ncbi:MAG: hypothetical protein KGL70_08235 [Betaproteobacteria bacterium]|nr:hypothetical protein [Betaproteobacteria bacterium]
MMKPARAIALALVIALAFAGCASQPPAPGPEAGTTPPERAAAGASGRAPTAAQAVPNPFASMPPPSVGDRLLALDPEHISGRDVRETLARGPAPRIILLHGGVFPVYLLMKSFGVFLTRMGYPESRIRDPADGDWSYSPYDDSAKLAGMVAWEYEHDGMRPMLLGHSQGGMQVIKVLHELAGDFAPSFRVFDPVTGQFEDRTTIVDPYSHRPRPVVGLSVAYASVVGAGGIELLMPNQWSMIDKLDTIPDTVDEFTGFSIDGDLIAWTFPGLNERYRGNGTAKVRNVDLPADYSHIFVPLVAPLAREPEVRDWINAYVPGGKHDTSSLPADANGHVLWAADVWYSIKKHWCLEAQRLVRAYRAGNREGSPEGQ